MKLKNKLIISFCCIVILPVVFSFIFGALLIKTQLLSVQYQYGINISLGDMIPHSSGVYEQIIRQLREDMKKELSQKEDSFWSDQEAIEAYCDSEAEGNLEILLMKDHSLYYETADLSAYLDNELKITDDLDSGESSVRYIGGKCVFLCHLLTDQFSDGSDADFYAVAYVSQLLPQVRVLIVQGILAIFFILFLTASLFTMWVYRSIVRPINVLKDATNKIKEGNLNFHITADEKDELGQLCIGFEEMRQKLKESAEEKIKFDEENRQLISNISHDLKTPITAIKGYVEGIMDGVADTPEKLNRYVKTIYNKSNDMDRLIDELTFYSKIDTNRIPYNFKKISVADYFADCADEVGTELESKNIRFQFADYVDEKVRIIADPEQLRRVINNIISNSVKYFDKEKCYINMRVRDVGDFIQVEIEDNGKGIAQKDLPLIFERFYRTDSSRNSARGGSGIGLSIVHKIIEDHGGKVWATSKEGTGTVMYFVLRKYTEPEEDKKQK